MSISRIFRCLLISTSLLAHRAQAQDSGADLSQTFRRAPPAVSQFILIPHQQSATGNAQLMVAFKSDARLGPTIDVVTGTATHGGKLVLQAASHTQMYHADLNFDFARFAAEQQRRSELARQYNSVPIFTGRQLTGHEPIRFIDPARIMQAVANQSPIEVSPDVLTGMPETVNPAQELMITDVSVVEDPTLTFDVCSGQGTPGGDWTFGKLMTDMANQTSTGVDPADFVESWLKTWETPQAVNGFTVAARPKIDTLLLNNWPRLANGKLDLTQAPMRLLAIVNRLDLRAGSLYGGGNVGEGRFVFSVLAKNGSACKTTEFTVIVEYGAPISDCASIHTWAGQWHALGAMTLGMPDFNAALHAITTQFTAAGASPAAANGSALDQLRTDEAALGFPWELRQFNLDASDHLLHPAAVAQTPDLGSLNDTTTLLDYIQSAESQLATGTNVVPAALPSGTAFLGGSALNPLGVWTAPGLPATPASNPLNDARDSFALATCNACHGSETHTSFLHISPRQSGVAATLSHFLLGDTNGTLLVPDTETVADPVSGAARSFGDLLRRQADLDSLIGGSCTSGGLLADFAFRPLNMTD